MPVALDIGGQVVTMFDPVTHVLQPVDEGNPLLRPETATNLRWARIRRPVITVGGELTMEQLDLNFNKLAKCYEAPVKLKANCGVLLVVFATNLEPRSLTDEAFLRRIPYKVHATNPSLEQFSTIFFMVCKKHGITFD
jgi:hypothetical protein